MLQSHLPNKPWQTNKTMVVAFHNEQTKGQPVHQPNLCVCDVTPPKCPSRLATGPVQSLCITRRTADGSAEVDSRLLNGSRYCFSDPKVQPLRCYDKKGVDRALGRCLEACEQYYDRQVAGRAEDERYLFGKEGCTPEVMLSDLEHQSCTQSVLAVGADSAEHTCQSFGLAPHPDLTFQWAQAGGDPSWLPLQMSDWVVTRVNKALEAITHLERGLSWHHRFGGRDDADSEFRRLQTQAHRCIFRALGPFVHQGSSLYLDRFNPATRAEKTHRVACTQHGSCQTVGGISGLQHQLHNVVLLRLNPLVGPEGLSAQVHLRSVADMNNIIRHPGSFGSGGQSVMSTEAYEDSHGNVGRHMHTMCYRPMPLVPHSASEPIAITKEVDSSGPRTLKVYSADTTDPNSLLHHYTVHNWNTCVDHMNKALLVQVDPPPFKQLPDNSVLLKKLAEATQLQNHVRVQLQLVRPQQTPPQFQFERLGMRASDDERAQTQQQCLQQLKALCAMAMHTHGPQASDSNHHSLNYMCQRMYDCKKPVFGPVLKLVQAYHHVCDLLKEQADRLLSSKYPKVRPMYLQHQAQLGGITNVLALAATRTRGIVLVHSVDDLVLLMIDRTTGTDPEYFSKCDKLQPLKQQSSVKSCLRHYADAPIRLGRYYKVPYTCSSNKNPDAKYNVAFAVEWQGHKTAVFVVDVRPSSRVRLVDGHTETNPDWGLKCIVCDIEGDQLVEK